MTVYLVGPDYIYCVHIYLQMAHTGTTEMSNYIYMQANAVDAEREMLTGPGYLRSSQRLIASTEQLLSSASALIHAQCRQQHLKHKKQWNQMQHG